MHEKVMKIYCILMVDSIAYCLWKAFIKFYFSFHKIPTQLHVASNIFKNATKDIFYFINLFLVAGKYISANNVTIHLECRYIIQYVL